MDESDCKDRFDKIDEAIGGLTKALNGEGGLITQVALHKQQLKDQPSPATLKFYASIGGGLVMVLSLIGFAFMRLFPGGTIPD